MQCLQAHFRGARNHRSNSSQLERKTEPAPSLPVRPAGHTDEVPPFFFCAQKSGSWSLKDGAELQKAHVIEQT